MSDETKTDTSKDGEALFTQAEVEDKIESRLNRDRKVRGDATAEKRELENDLASLRREHTALKSSHKAELAKAVAESAAEKEATIGELREYKAEVTLAAALAKAGIKTELQPGALALLKSKGIEVVDGDGGPKLTINKKPLEDAITDLGDVYLAAAPGGGSGATGTPGDSGAVTGTKAWAKDIINDAPRFRDMSLEERDKVMKAITTGE